MQTKRNTKQKDFVLNNLKNRFDHPTAFQIYLDSCKEDIKIGEVSVYRILNNLVEEGKVCKIVTKDNVAHFDFNRDNHIHFVCNVCNEIIDRNCTSNLEKEIEKLSKKFKISKQDMNIYGICEKCQNKITD